jgi:hypothetical protein
MVIDGEGAIWKGFLQMLDALKYQMKSLSSARRV